MTEMTPFSVAARMDAPSLIPEQWYWINLPVNYPRNETMFNINDVLTCLECCTKCGLEKHTNSPGRGGAFAIRRIALYRAGLPSMTGAEDIGETGRPSIELDLDSAPERGEPRGWGEQKGAQFVPLLSWIGCDDCGD